MDWYLLEDNRYFQRGNQGFQRRNWWQWTSTRINESWAEIIGHKSYWQVDGLVESDGAKNGKKRQAFKRSDWVLPAKAAGLDKKIDRDLCGYLGTLLSFQWSFPEVRWIGDPGSFSRWAQALYPLWQIFGHWNAWGNPSSSYFKAPLRKLHEARRGKQRYFERKQRNLFDWISGWELRKDHCEPEL